MHTSATWGVVALVAIALWSCLCGASIQANYPCSLVGQWQQVGLGSGSNLTMTFNSTRFYTFNVSILSATRCVRAQSHRHIVACAWLCVCVAGNFAYHPLSVQLCPNGAVVGECPLAAVQCAHAAAQVLPRCLACHTCRSPESLTWFFPRSTQHQPLRAAAAT